MCVERKRDKNAVCINLYIKCMRMYAAALQSVSSSPFHHTCCSISSPRHSWLKFCPSCSSGNLAVCAPLTPAMRAVNCWLLFHSDLESARQQSKAFAFKALKLIWNAKGSYWKYVFNGGGRLGNVYQGQRGDWLRSVRDRISSHVLLNTTFSLSLLTPTLVPTPPTPLSPSLSLCVAACSPSSGRSWRRGHRIRPCGWKERLCFCQEAGWALPVTAGDLSGGNMA